ncbi:MAG: RloB family protein [Firmicutes bacterium]|nr:RloB family protein [Bacillota bacterium]
MPRTKLSRERLVYVRETYVGRIIIFCEGQTEQYYFDYFADILNKDKYNDVEVKTELGGGNAQGVLNAANKFLKDEHNNRKFDKYKKYLAFDCDAPSDVQRVINDAAASANDYKLLVSNFLFEVWLLMHFEDITEEYKRQTIYNKLTEHLNVEYKKASKGIIRKVISNGDIEKAIENAKLLDEQYAKENKSIFSSIEIMNPYTNVYELVEQLLVAISK